MIDININAIFSQALAAAVQQATAPLLAQIAALETRLLALENNPAQGVDTTLEETLQRLDNQEWFWNKLRNFTDTAVEQAVEQHCEEYDHDDFVTEERLEDYVTKDDLRDEISDAVHDKLDNATLSIRF